MRAETCSCDLLRSRMSFAADDALVAAIAEVRPTRIPEATEEADLTRLSLQHYNKDRAGFTKKVSRRGGERGAMQQLTLLDSSGAGVGEHRKHP